MKGNHLGASPTALARCGTWMAAMGISAFACSAQLTNYVTTATDAGPGSFRQAIHDANQAGGGIIQFSDVAETIPLLTSLPALTGRTTIIGPGTNLIAVSASISPLSIETQAVVRFINFVFPPESLTISNKGSVTFSECVVSPNLTIWNQGRLTIFGSLQHLNRGPLTVMGNGTTIIYDQHYQGIDLTGGELQLFGCLSANRNRRGSSGGERCEQNPFDPSVIRCEYYKAGAGYGGGVMINYGTLAMTGCSIVNNQAVGGTGVWAGSGLGGGLYVGGTLRMTNCTVNGNIAKGGSGVQGYRVSCAHGAAVGGGICVAGDAVIVNSTISGNRAEPGSPPTSNGDCAPRDSIGAGIALQAGRLLILNCTISENVAIPGIGGFVHSYLGSAEYPSGIGVGGISSIYINEFGWADKRLLIQNSIVAGNVGASAIPQPLEHQYQVTPCDALGSIESLGHNLFGTTNAIVRDVYLSVPISEYLTGLIDSDLVRPGHGLGPLQDNGGPTWTHALLPGSPAIDAAKNLGMDYDQRGRRRTCESIDVPNPPGGDGTDIGAFELEQSLCFTDVQRVGDHIQLSFPSVLGRSYFIEHGSIPTGGPWQRLPGNIVGTGGMVSYRHTNAAVIGIHFYRTAELGSP